MDQCVPDRVPRGQSPFSLHRKSSLIFVQVRDWKELVVLVSFLAIVVGVGLGAANNFWGQSHHNNRLLAKNDELVPEARLSSMMIGYLFSAAGLFIMAWTGDAAIQWTG